jgi:hypothetical protein
MVIVASLTSLAPLADQLTVGSSIGWRCGSICTWATKSKLGGSSRELGGQGRMEIILILARFRPLAGRWAHRHVLYRRRA